MDNLSFIGKWAAAGAIAAWLKLSMAVHILLIFMALDFATGLLSGYVNKKLDSEVSRRGIAKKTMMLLLIVAAHFAATAIGITYDLGSLVATAYAINELISITENCASAGVPIPQALIDALQKAKKMAATSWDGGERRTEQEQFTGPDRRGNGTTDSRP